MWEVVDALVWVETNGWLAMQGRVLRRGWNGMTAGGCGASEVEASMRWVVGSWAGVRRIGRCIVASLTRVMTWLIGDDCVCRVGRCCAMCETEDG